MWRPMGPALRMMLMLTLITGIAYPLIMTGVCQMLFPAQANGSLVKVGGAVAGSRLIGQRFTAPWYFHGRPSASGDNPEQSGGSNLGPTSRVLSNRVGAAVAAFRRQNPTFQGPVPADIVTESGSGLDPDISPAAAVAQVGRVAAARGAPPGQVLALVRRWTAPPQLGFLGEARVNVLELNLALDRQFGRASRPASAALGQKP